MTTFTPAFMQKQRELEAKASGGTWTADLHGLYVTTDRCPLCTKQSDSHLMVTSAPVVLDEEEKELIQIRDWGHLQKHGDGERVQMANAELICAARNNFIPMLDEITRLQHQLAIAREALKKGKELACSIGVNHSSLSPLEIGSILREAETAIAALDTEQETK